MKLSESNGLNPRQARAAALVAAGLSCRAAAAKCGLSERWVQQLANRPDFKQHVAHLQTLVVRRVVAQLTRASTEAAKVKVAIALSAPPLVHFDNVEEGTSYGNSSLDSALTARSIDDRILGQSRRTGDIVLRTTWFLSGNNIGPGKDAHQRWLPCNLVSTLEHPEERDDVEQENLRAYTLARRPELVQAALTILRAHARAGYPRAGRARLGSFEEWDRIVRGAVHYSYEVDPCETRRRAAEDAPERTDKLALLEAWHALPCGGTGGRGITAQEALAMADQRDATAWEPAEAYACPALRDALIGATTDGKLPTVRSLGNRIRAMAGAIIGGLRFRKAGEDHRSVRWIAEKVSPDNPI